MSSARPLAWLVYRDSTGPHAVPLAPPGVVVGRDPAQCDVVVKDFGMSRQHARIAVDPEGRLTLSDLKSKSGSQVNGKPVAEATLAMNDTLLLGGVTFLITAAPPAADGGDVGAKAPARALASAETAIERLPSQHYLLAHRVLRDLLWQGDSMLGILANPENQRFLGDQWDYVASAYKCAPSGGRERLAYSTHWVGGDNLTVLITMPPPSQITEAHLIAITTSPALRYFTLELAQNVDGRRGTVLGEWTVTGHDNFGEGPPPDPLLFLQAVCRGMRLPPTIEEPTVGQRVGMSRTESVHLGIMMEPADLAALQARTQEAESLEWDLQHEPALAKYRACLQEFLPRYREPPTDVTLLYAGVVRCLKGLGQLKAAEAEARRWWTMVRRFRMLGHAEAMMASRLLAEILAEQGRLDEALALYRHRVLLAGLARGSSSPMLQAAAEDLDRFQPR